MQAKDLVKARLWCLEDNDWSIELQFNPSEIDISRTSSVKEPSGFGEVMGGAPDFEAGESDSLTFKTLVDTSMAGEIDLADAADFEAQMLSALNSLLSSSEENDESVLPEVQKYYRLTTPIKPSGLEEAEARPPVVAFIWDTFEFMGFITKCDIEFLLFDESGKAKRAEISIEIEGQAFSGNLTLEEFLDNHHTPPSTTDTGDRQAGDATDSDSPED